MLRNILLISTNQPAILFVPTILPFFEQLLPKQEYKNRTELRYTSANILPPVGMTLSLQHLLTFKNSFFKKNKNAITYNTITMHQKIIHNTQIPK